MTLLEALIGKTWFSHDVEYVVRQAFAYSKGWENILIQTRSGNWMMTTDIEYSKAIQNIWQPEDIEIVWSELYGRFIIQEITIGERTLADV